MPPVGGHIGKWHQHEGAVLQARVRQDQLIGRIGALRLRIKGQPVRLRRGIGQNGIPKCDQIKIKCSHSPALGAFSPKLVFNIMQHSQHTRGIPSLRHGRGGSGIHIVRASPRRKAGRGEKSAWNQAFKSTFNQNVKGRTNGVSGRRLVNRQVCADCNQKLSVRRHVSIPFRIERLAVIGPTLILIYVLANGIYLELHQTSNAIGVAMNLRGCINVL